MPWVKPTTSAAIDEAMMCSVLRVKDKTRKVLKARGAIIAASMPAGIAACSSGLVLLTADSFSLGGGAMGSVTGCKHCSTLECGDA